MALANERFFQGDEALAQATGMTLGYAMQQRYSQPLTDSKGRPVRKPEGGIIDPVRVTLSPGEVLVRYDGTSRPSLAVRGGWWLRWAQYERLTLIARAAAIDLDEVFRELCYVPPEWNNLHVVVQVRVTAPLGAYEGPGVPVASIVPTLAVSNIVGREPILQLFVPGLASDAGKYAIAIEGQGFQPGTL